MSKVLGCFMEDFHAASYLLWTFNQNVVACWMCGDVYFMWFLNRKSNQLLIEYSTFIQSPYVVVNDVNLSKAQQIVLIVDFIMQTMWFWPIIETVLGLYCFILNHKISYNRNDHLLMIDFKVNPYLPLSYLSPIEYVMKSLP